MVTSSFSRIVPILGLLALSACATAPSRIDDVCAVFEHGNGWFDDWRAAAKRSERKYGVPVAVLMATLRKESGFKSNAKPPRTKLMGFIPWKRPSSAYGFSQALDGTWSQYQREAGNAAARRTNFADAVDFVGWYHAKTAEKYGIARDDTFNLYLAYYSGWTGYKRGDWKANPGLQRYARETERMAQKYATQLPDCGR